MQPCVILLLQNIEDNSHKVKTANQKILSLII